MARAELCVSVTVAVTVTVTSLSLSLSLSLSHLPRVEMLQHLLLRPAYEGMAGVPVHVSHATRCLGMSHATRCLGILILNTPVDTLVFM